MENAVRFDGNNRHEPEKIRHQEKQEHMFILWLQESQKKCAQTLDTSPIQSKTWRNITYMEPVATTNNFQSGGGGGSGGGGACGDKYDEVGDGTGGDHDFDDKRR